MGEIRTLKVYPYHHKNQIPIFPHSSRPSIWPRLFYRVPPESILRGFLHRWSRWDDRYYGRETEALTLFL
jgi:hypothetical protein